MQGFAQQAAETKTVKQARGLTSEAVAVIRAHLDLQRNHEKAAKTMAIVSVVSEAGLRRSKTDPTGAGAVVAITAMAMADLDLLREFAGPAESDSVFNLGDRQITNRIAAAATVMRQGRWSTTRMVARYTRNESAGEALRYLQASRTDPFRRFDHVDRGFRPD